MEKIKNEILDVRNVNAIIINSGVHDSVELKEVLVWDVWSEEAPYHIGAFLKQENAIEAFKTAKASSIELTKYYVRQPDWFRNIVHNPGRTPAITVSTIDSKYGEIMLGVAFNQEQKDRLVAVANNRGITELLFDTSLVDVDISDTKDFLITGSIQNWTLNPTGPLDLVEPREVKNHLDTVSGQQQQVVNQHIPNIPIFDSLARLPACGLSTGVGYGNVFYTYTGSSSSPVSVNTYPVGIGSTGSNGDILVHKGNNEWEYRQPSVKGYVDNDGDVKIEEPPQELKRTISIGTPGITVNNSRLVIDLAKTDFIDSSKPDVKEEKSVNDLGVNIVDTSSSNSPEVEYRTVYGVFNSQNHACVGMGNNIQEAEEALKIVSPTLKEEPYIMRTRVIFAPPGTQVFGVNCTGVIDAYKYE